MKNLFGRVEKYEKFEKHLTKQLKYGQADLGAFLDVAVVRDCLPKGWDTFVTMLRTWSATVVAEEDGARVAKEERAAVGALESVCAFSPCGFRLGPASGSGPGFGSGSRRRASRSAQSTAPEPVRPSTCEGTGGGEGEGDGECPGQAKRCGTQEAF